MKFLITSLILFTNFIQAQCNINSVQSCELVNNGDFENYSSIPNTFGQIDKACGWHNANIASPDYFNILANPSVLNNVSIPCNSLGIQSDNMPTNGAYAGILSIQNNLKEFIYSELNQSLIPNTTYKLLFDLSLAEGSSIYYNFINAYLSPDTSFISLNNISTNPNGLILQNNLYCDSIDK